jgi:hypothetical protein
MPYLRLAGLKVSGFRYWFPYPFCSPQSGHCQVIPLQDIPQKFFSMQFWQMENPHRHLQQNGGCLPQQAQGISFATRRFSLYKDRMGR